MADLLKNIGMVCATAPERIWLQADPEPEEDGKPVYPTNPSADDVTWCADQINSSDTLYIRADKVLEMLRAHGVVVDHHQGPEPSDADASKDRP